MGKKYKCRSSSTEITVDFYFLENTKKSFKHAELLNQILEYSA